jgi:glutamate carboxypeptidase
VTAAEGLAVFRDRASEFVDPCLRLLGDLVTAESPSAVPDRNLRVAAGLRGELERRGATVERHPAPGYGEHLVARVEGASGAGPPLLVIGHMDTVYAVGTLARVPFAIEVAQDRVRGPGAYDMKGGLAVAITALDLLFLGGHRPAGDLLFLITCDEELGSPTSRGLIEEHARCARGALVLEPSVSGGAAKTRRKGMGRFRVSVRGRSAHTGVDPEAGASAIHELIRILEDIRLLGDSNKGTTLNVGVIQGGTRANVVAEHAHADVDLRFWAAGEADRVERAVRSVRVSDPRCTISVEGGVNRGALEVTEASAALFARARAVAAAQGWDLAEGSTGGVSDGNLTSALGCPTLDGLGPDGGGAHSLDEHVRLSDIAPRIALLAGIFLRF